MIERKRSWKHKVKPCDDLDGASRQDNAEKHGTPEKKIWKTWNRECDMMNHSRIIINHLDETRIRIMLCISFTNLNWWQATDLAYYLFSLKRIKKRYSAKLGRSSTNHQ